MAIAEVKSSNEQKKMIAAVALVVAALIALWWTFIGFGGSSKPQTRIANRAAGTASPMPMKTQDHQQPDNSQDASTLNDLKPIPVSWTQPALAAEPRRNIFAFYVPLPPTPRPSPTLPPPSPTPTPPLLLASVSPSNVYARTDDFTLEITGDKFTSATRIAIDGRELPTRYISPQQISATVPAAMIANPGQRQVVARSSDGTLYSNAAILNVTAPPTPNYIYVGIIGKPRHIGDTALLLDKSSKEIVSVQRGEILGGKFRVTSISASELVVIDVNLKIPHKLALTNESGKSPFPQGRPTPKVDVDDEP
jgi:hypothetical protein